MARISGSQPSPHEELYTSAAEFVAAAQQPTHLEAYPQKFRDRLRDHGGGESADPMNPLLVEKEKEGQKDAFRGLKFTFLDQEAKRQFLFSITGDAPQVVEEGENDALEAENAVKKAKLKAVKDDIEAMRQESIKLSAENAKRHAMVQQQSAEVASVSKQIRDMELELARLKSNYPVEDRITTAEAMEKLDEQEQEFERLTEATMAAKAETDALRAEVAQAAKEAMQLGKEREREQARADEVRRSRAAEGTGTRVHELCRWYAASLTTYRALLGIRSARATSDSELVLEYDVPSESVAGGRAEITLQFGEDRRLISALFNGSEGDSTFQQLVATAREANDAPGLIADVLMRLRPLIGEVA